MTGRSPSGPGSRASHEAAKASSPKASIPSAAAMDIALSEAGFVHGAQSMREMLARFVETSPPTDLKVVAGSMRANWHPGWGVDPGPLTGTIPDNPLGDLALDIELLDIEREAEAGEAGQEMPVTPEMLEAATNVPAWRGDEWIHADFLPAIYEAMRAIDPAFASAIETQSAKTAGLGPQDESAVPQADAHD